jgi:hypothetical protein
LIDATDGTLTADRQRHVERCDACRQEVSTLAAVLHEAGSAPVPEPSPLFWEHFSVRVRDAVRAEESRKRRWSDWLRWPTLVPVGGLAAIVVAMVASIPGGVAVVEPGSTATPLTSAPGAPPEPASSADLEWSALAELVGPLEWDTAGAAGLTLAPGDVELGVLELTEDERQELSRLIAGELARVKS